MKKKTKNIILNGYLITDKDGDPLVLRNKFLLYIDKVSAEADIDSTCEFIRKIKIKIKEK